MTSNNNPNIWRDKIALLLKIIPLKLNEFDNLKKSEDSIEIEAEIYGLMQATKLYSFAISNNAQVDIDLKTQVRAASFL